MVPRFRRQLCGLVLLASACQSAPAATDVPAPMEAPPIPLAQLAAQRVIITPTYSLLAGDALGWGTSISKPRDYLKTLDDTLARILGDRGLKTQWIYPADLVRAMKGSPTYAIDPYTLGTNVLRNPGVAAGFRLNNPIATQLRTMIALQEDARAVLMPVELRFEKLATGQGVAALRVALVDGRIGEVRWIGWVKSDPADSLSPAVLASLSTHLADLVTSP